MKGENMEGIIKALRAGFGFISCEGQPKDVFFHAKDLATGLTFNELKEGDKVTFELANGPKGPFAQNVKRS